MNRIVNSIISIILTISMILYITLIDVNAQERSNVLSKGQYLIINSKTNKLGYFENGVFVKEFPVATGKASTPTPQGKFKIVNKIKNRPYYSGGIPGGSPNNPLGDRWLGLHVGITYGTNYAIHGNNNASSIGKHVSGGCIRMHNSDIRWLFEQINVGAYAIIDSSDKAFTQIAYKYGIKLQDTESQNINDLKNAYKEFINYNGMDLLSRNSVITKSSDADNILNSKNNYINAYNKLTESEKNNSEVKGINYNYNKVLSIIETTQAILKFYEHVSLNSNNLIYNSEWANILNNGNDNTLGTKYRALKEYSEMLSYDETKDNSTRVAYLDELYWDSVRFLNVSQYLGNKNIKLAKSESDKIKDYNLSRIAKSVINAQKDILGHWAENNIEEAMQLGWVDTSNSFRPDDSITRAEFVKIINRVFNFTEVTDISFSDVNTSDWFYNEVSIAVNSGYIDGYEDNTFKPYDKISRQEVAKIITTIKNNYDENIDKIYNYKDYNSISDWAISYVEGAVESSYMGVNEVQFRPQDSITRAESIVTLKRSK